jgi:hypothetical protein
MEKLISSPSGDVTRGALALCPFDIWTLPAIVGLRHKRVDGIRYPKPVHESDSGLEGKGAINWRLSSLRHAVHAKCAFTAGSEPFGSTMVAELISLNTPLCYAY